MSAKPDASSVHALSSLDSKSTSLICRLHRRRKPIGVVSMTPKPFRPRRSPPDVLAAIVQDAIDQRIDRDAYRVVLEHEARIRDRLSEELNPLLEVDWDDRNEEDAL
jgi:hypothetical protein